jgi:hypothetical protein
MAEESKFLKWQDANGDMLPDVCPEPAKPRVNTCLPCSPNPNASVPDWKARNQSQPFLNEKLCKYQISYMTKEKTLGYKAGATKKAAAEALDNIWEHYASEWDNNADHSLPPDWLQSVPHRKGEPRKGAIRALLDWKGKDKSDESVQKISDALEKTEYYLAPNPGSYVQLLYSVEYSVLEDLPDAPPEQEDDEAELGDQTVKYAVGDMVKDQITVRKGLHLWNRYLKVYRMLESSNLVFKDSGRIFNLEDYGDAGPFDMYGQVSIVQTELDSWLNERGYNIPNTGTWGLTSQNVEHIEFTVTGEYKLKKITIWTDMCNEMPIEFGKDRVEGLATMPGWRDSTAVAYFMKLSEIASDLKARQEQPWLEMVQKYTYPKLRTVGPGAGQIMPSGETSTTTCVANALANEGKQLGQFVLDQMFTIGDAIAYEFHASLCQTDKDAVNEDKKEVGQGVGAQGGAPAPEPRQGKKAPPAPPKKNKKEPKKKTTMWSAALMQANKEIDPRDQVFAHFCTRMMMGVKGEAQSVGDLEDQISAMSFERIKVCGMFDLLVSTVECLTKGLSLEKALGIMLKNALSAMTYDDFGKLFVGLSPEKQKKLDELVRRNLEEGKTTKDWTRTYTSDEKSRMTAEERARVEDKEKAEQKESGNRFFGKVSFTKPWEDPELVAAQKARAKENPVGGNDVAIESPMERNLQKMAENQASETKRTIAKSLDAAAVAKEQGLDPNNIFQAYILALLEEYSENYLALLDKLNDFPGAQIISFLITSIDCPRPPLFNPGLDDFVKSITLPFCRNNAEITMPRLMWPGWWYPIVVDPWGKLFEYLKTKLRELIFKLQVMIIVKVCELLGKAICKALEIAGQFVASLPAQIAGTTTLTDIIKDSICGPETPTQEVEDTVVQLIANLGVGGQAFTNPERALTFAEDLSAAATQAEMSSAVLGKPSETFLIIADQIVENGYPEYRDALPNKRSIGRFFENIGFLIPAQLRDDMDLALETLGAEAALDPANPTLCATPDQMENFKALRCQLLEGRATPEQCNEMFDNWRGTMLDDLDTVSSLMQKGIGPSVMEQMPPLQSDPGCNNGILPFEPEGTINTANNNIQGDLNKIQQAYARDMLGSGGFMGWLWGGVDSSWGFLNMVLSDTMGNPFTRHQVDVAGDSDYVDFYLDVDNSWMLTAPVEKAMSVPVAGLPSQRGAYPKYVAEWLMYQYRAAAGLEVDSRLKLGRITEDLKETMAFESTNTPRAIEKWPVSFSNLGFDSLFTTSDVELTDVPDMGYNVRTAPDWDQENLWFIKMPRKDQPDIALDFKDNSRGYRMGLNAPLLKPSSWSYMFRVNAYFSDMVETSVAGSYANRPDDNVRIYLTEFYNQNATTTSTTHPPPPDAFGYNGDGAATKASAGPTVSDTDDILRHRKSEFIAVDNGLDSLYFPDPDKGELLSIDNFPSLSQSFMRQDPYSPQVNMLHDLFNAKVSKSTIKDKYDAFMEAQFAAVAREIGSNTKAWEYGMSFDDLDITDFDYVDENGDLYSEKTVKDYDSNGEELPDQRPLVEDDMILGKSRNQYINEQNGTHPQNTRVFFLNPTQYGGSYMQPPIYVRPRKAAGYSGLIEVLFPELSPCDPSSTNAVDFDQIASKISEVYPTLADDVRLRGDPDCVDERPYNRILHRQSKATIEGIIAAAIRVYASVHLIKGLPLFTKFAPKFPDNYSNIYASYVVEIMEEDFRDSTSLWSPFSDNEFWFAFLEQAVQTYGRRIDSGDIAEEEVPKHVMDALERLNDYQERFNYPYGNELMNAKYSGEASWFETLKSYRESRNLEAIYRTQEDAKLILKELVNEQLQFMGNKYSKTLENFDMAPEVYDLDYYYMANFTALGDNELNLQGTVIEAVAGLPTKEEPDPAGLGWEWPGPFYTDGGEFSLPDGSAYVGYYHANIDEQDGGTTYMVGEYHSDGEHEAIRPFANKVIVGVEKVQMKDYPDPEAGMEGKAAQEVTFTALGDIPDGARGASSGPSSEQPFYMYKYIKVDNERLSNAVAVAKVKAAGSGPISLSFPGTMRIVTNDEDVQIGIEGELGVRYGLDFGMTIDGTDYSISNIEIDALDVPVTAFTGIEANSKILYCLLAKLKEDQKFKLVTNYAFSFKKVLSIMAIYQDMGFMPSIGEVTVAEGALYGDFFHEVAWSDPETNSSADIKPGAYAELELGSVDVTRENWLGLESTETVTTVEGATLKYAPGWAAEGDRLKAGGLFSHMAWDNWDKKALRHSASAIKRLFRVHYRSREFDSMADEEMGTLTKEYVQQMKERFKIDPSRAILPWWQTRRLKSNPFNENGEMCKKKDS